MDKPSESRGMALAFVGVLMFGATLPATRLALEGFDPGFVALARAELAALLAGLALWIARAPLPAREHWRALMITAAGVVLGFPLFSSIAMRTSDASHGAVVNGLLPFATALAAMGRAHERPSPGFWIAAASGSALVVAFALHAGGGTLRAGDWAMLAAVAAGAIGYAEGGRLAARLGGWQTIAWALVAAAPWLLAPALWSAAQQPFARAGARAWAGLAYVAVVSQFLGFLFWYGGMAIGGVARVSQVQLLQLFVTLAIAAALMGEAVAPGTWAVAAAVVALVAAGRRAPVRRTSIPGDAR